MSVKYWRWPMQYFSRTTFGREIAVKIFQFFYSGAQIIYDRNEKPVNGDGPVIERWEHEYTMVKCAREE
jgi:hypothetical protein